MPNFFDFTYVFIDGNGSEHREIRPALVVKPDSSNRREYIYNNRGEVVNTINHKQSEVVVFLSFSDPMLASNDGTMSRTPVIYVDNDLIAPPEEPTPEIPEISEIGAG